MGREAGAESRRERARRYANWVQQEMEHRKWNQSRLSARSGLHPNVVSAIVKGAAVQPAPEQLAAVASVFGVTPTDVMREAGWWDDGESVKKPPAPFEVIDALELVRAAGARLESYLEAAGSEQSAAETTPTPTPEPTPSPPDDELDWDITTEPVAAASGRNVDQILRAERDMQEREKDEEDEDESSGGGE